MLYYVILCPAHLGHTMLYVIVISHKSYKAKQKRAYPIKYNMYIWPSCGLWICFFYFLKEHFETQQRLHTKRNNAPPPPPPIPVTRVSVVMGGSGKLPPPSRHTVSF